MSETKRCAKCGEIKAVDQFQKHARSSDGLQSYCRVCTKESSTQWRADNRERTRELGRKNKEAQRKRDGEQKTKKKWNEWYAKNAEHRKAYQMAQNDPLKKKAHNILNAEIRAGRITRPLHCEKCGKESRVDGHHTDYSKPLVVIWLCRSCHRKEQG